MSYTFTVSEHHDGRRLDKVIRTLWPTLPLGAMMKGIRKGLVRVDGKKVACSVRLEEGQSVYVPWERPEEHNHSFAMQKNEKKKTTERRIPLAVVYKDQLLMVLNKRAGLLVQPDESGEESLIEQVWAEVPPEEDFRACAVHRLDRNTTGLVVVALHGQAVRELQRAFRDDDVRKTYLVAVYGKTPQEGDITLPLLKDRDKNIVKVDPSGQVAHTHFEKIAGDDKYSLLKVHLLTGRSHQIRVHLASLNYPVVGDVKYGASAVNKEWYRRIHLSHPLLHAWSISFHNMKAPLEYLEGRVFPAEPDNLFYKFLQIKGWQKYCKGV